MQFVTTDEVVQVPEGTSPSYNIENPILKVEKAVEKNKLAAEFEYYDLPSLQYLFQYSHLKLYGPQGKDAAILDPIQQDNKEDFQKQNINDFTLGNTFVVRGWVKINDWKGPFLKLSYSATDTTLYEKGNNNLGNQIKLFLKIGDLAVPELLTVPYNDEADRYEVELWGYPGGNLAEQLDEKGRASLANGTILVRPDIIYGTVDDFQVENLSNIAIAEHSVNHLMHPILPLDLELAWADKTETFWDSKGGENYRMQFGMAFRGWNNFLKAGISANPHGGLGFLEFRNLFSNYFEHKQRNQLGRKLESWNIDANGQKGAREAEKFMTVDYMDLHVLRPSCSIGIHRHRDNQEVFFMMEGQGLMVVGDFMSFEDRERCFEVRTMKTGDLTLCKAGQLHALFNLTDTNIKLFMFGGYD